MTNKELTAAKVEFIEAHRNLNELIMLSAIDNYLGKNQCATSCISDIRNYDDSLNIMHDHFNEVCAALEETLDKLEEVNKEINFDLKRLAKYTEKEESDDEE